MPPPSISTDTSVNNGPVLLPLFKLSYSTSATTGSNMLWTHLPNRDNMYAVFDVVRRVDPRGSVVERKILKLIRGGDLMEQIDLDILRQQVQMDEERCRSQQIPDQDLYVIVIVKRPLLALRYKLPDGQIRRLQLNFRPPSGFDVAFDVMRALGLPIRDKDQTTFPPPLVHRSHTAQSIYPSFSQTSPQRPEHGFSTYYDYLPPSAQPPPKQTPYPASMTGVDQDDFSRPIMPPLSRKASVGSSTGTRERTYRQLGPVRPYSSSDILGLHTNHNIPSRKPENLMLSPSVLSQQTTAFGEFGLRPISAPETQSEPLVPDTVPLSQMLPPERALPFPEKNEKPISQDSKIPETLTVPPKTTKAAAAKVVKPRKSRAKDSKAKSPARKPSLPTPAPSTSSPKVPKRKTAGPRKATGKPPSSSAPPRAANTPKRRTRPVSPISDTVAPPLSPIKSSLTALAEASANTGKTSAIGANKLPEPFSLSSVQPQEFLSSLDNWIRRYHDIPAPEPPRTAKDHLAEYAAQSEEQRAKVIDDLICDCLDDENFGKLVEDVEGAWRRIGLGF